MCTKYYLLAVERAAVDLRRLSSTPKDSTTEYLLELQEAARVAVHLSEVVLAAVGLEAVDLRHCHEPLRFKISSKAPLGGAAGGAFRGALGGGPRGGGPRGGGPRGGGPLGGRPLGGGPSIVVSADHARK